MQDFCATPLGKIGLVQRIKDHFDYAYAHLSIYQDATRFHRELSTFFPLDTIVMSWFGDSAYCYGYSNAYLYASLTNEERKNMSSTFILLFRQ
jgi:hypothetical protein